MGGIKRFEDHRFVGDRATMLLYDTEDAEQAARLQERIESDRLFARNLLQTFAPDDVAEARNRGFRPAVRSVVD